MLGIDGYIVGHLMAIEPMEYTIPEWIYYILCQIDMMNHSDNTGYPSLKQSVVQKIRIPFPPLDEQKMGIVKILKEKLTAVEKAKKASEEKLQAANTLKQSYLDQIFNEEKLTKNLPQGWKLVKLREVIKEALPGFACGQRDPKGTIQIRMNNVDTFGNLTLDDFIRVPANDELLKKYTLKEDDVLFNNTNSAELVGKTAIFKNHSEPVVYSNHFTRIRPIENLLLPVYLAKWLLNQWQNKIFEKICNRWIGQSAVKNEKLLKRYFPLPPLDEQKKIILQLNHQFEKGDKLIENIQTELELINTLPRSYLKQAFEGKL